LFLYRRMRGVTIPSASREPRRIIVVDDDAAVLGFVTRSLTLAGHDVTDCATFDAGKAALAHSTPDVVIVDIRLGGFNGLQLIWIVRDQYPQVQAIVIIGFDDRDLRHEAAKMGATFVVKPFSA